MKLEAYREVPKSEWLGKAKPRGQDQKREAVRQWFLAQLRESYFFPSEWLSSRAVFIDGQSEEPFRTPDGFFGFCLITQKGDPFLWVSLDVAGRASDAEGRLREILRGSPFCRLGVSSDGSPGNTRCLRQRSNSDECDYVLDIEPFASPDGMRLVRPYTAPGGAGGPELEPISNTLEDVFFEAHSHIRDIDGMHADEALDELCKVLYAKLFDEEQAKAGEPYALQKGLTATAEEFAAVIRRVYVDANEYDVRVFSLKVPGYDRSRGVFNSPIRLSSPALVRVVETIAPYWLTRSSIDVKGRAFQRVLGPSLRAGMGQYFTPLEVINFIVGVVRPSVNELVLDPFAGSGHFLTRSLDQVRAEARLGDEKRVDEFAFNKLHGIEKSDRMVRIAMTDMRLHGDGHSNIRCTDSLLDFTNYPDIRADSFDVVLTNPPFGSLLGPEALSRLGRFQLANGRKNVPLEVLGLERCMQFLRPGGRLGIVLPDGMLANRGTEYVREQVAAWGKLRAVVSLPIETFSPFGANIKTSVLFLRKWKSGERRDADYRVHMVKIDNVGYDATGRAVADSETERAAASVRAFLDTEGW